MLFISNFIKKVIYHAWSTFSYITTYRSSHSFPWNPTRDITLTIFFISPSFIEGYQICATASSVNNSPFSKRFCEIYEFASNTFFYWSLQTVSGQVWTASSLTITLTHPRILSFSMVYVISNCNVKTSLAIFM